MYNIKSIVSLVSLAVFAMHSHAQQLYLDATYDSVSVETVNYSDVFTDNFHKMDIYQPVGDPTEKDRYWFIYTEELSMLGIKQPKIASISVPNLRKKAT